MLRIQADKLLLSAPPRNDADKLRRVFSVLLLLLARRALDRAPAALHTPAEFVLPEFDTVDSDTVVNAKEARSTRSRRLLDGRASDT